MSGSSNGYTTNFAASKSTSSSSALSSSKSTPPVVGSGGGGGGVTFSDAERKSRWERLYECFVACDMDANGVIDGGELEVVVQAFVPRANVKAEVKALLSKFDRNNDSKIDAHEWCSVCFDLFAGMTHDQFNKHCEKLIHVIHTYTQNHHTANTTTGLQHHTSNNANAHSQQSLTPERTKFLRTAQFTAAPSAPPATTAATSVSSSGLSSGVSTGPGSGSGSPPPYPLPPHLSVGATTNGAAAMNGDSLSPASAAALQAAAAAVVAASAPLHHPTHALPLAAPTQS